MSEDSAPKHTAPQPHEQGQYNPQDSSAPTAYSTSDQSAMPQEPDREVTWTALEFIAHHKDIRWYAIVIGITLVLAAIVRLLTRDNISTVMVLIVGIFFCVAAARKPRMLTYTLNEDGLLIGGRFMPYTDFRSFTVFTDGRYSNIELIPMKRFMPLTSIYCSPESEDDVVDMLADFIPYEDRTHSFIDWLAHLIRF